MDGRLINFLMLVPTSKWRRVPKGWSGQYRAALSEGFVEKKRGRALVLTDAGRAIFTLETVLPTTPKR